MTYPTDLERYAMNPHGLDSGDRCIMPDGSAAVIDRAGFQWARFSDRAPCLLKDLRPYSDDEAGRSRLTQLSLFGDDTHDYNYR